MLEQPECACGQVSSSADDRLGSNRCGYGTLQVASRSRLILLNSSVRLPSQCTMRRHTVLGRAAAALPAETFTDQAVEDALRAAFAPHRCDVQFQLDAFTQLRKVALVIHAVRDGVGAIEQEFVVEGIDVESLRRRQALLDYIDDVREQLQQRRVRFAANVRCVPKSW